MTNLSDFLADFEAERLAEIARDEARRNSPAIKAALAAKRSAEALSQTRNRRHSIRTERSCPVSLWNIA